MAEVEAPVSAVPPASGLARFMAQFSGPHGPLGHVAGWMMARMNRPANEWVVEQLRVAPTSRVLEIGFGPGVAVAMLAERCRFVAGIDKSDVMLQQARRRNRAACADGVVDLRLGSPSELPFGDAQFTHAFAVNSFQFWPDPNAALRELARVLEPGGVLLLAQRMFQEGAGPRDRRRFGMTEHRLGEVRAALLDAGFDLDTCERRVIRDETIVALRALRRA